MATHFINSAGARYSELKRCQIHLKRSTNFWRYAFAEAVEMKL